MRDPPAGRRNTSDKGCLRKESEMEKITVSPGKLTLAQMKKMYERPVTVELSPDAEERINQSVACVKECVSAHKIVYGINTGFGILANKRISDNELELLQRSLVLSHSAGVGEAVEDDLVRLIMLLKVNGLARGYSGVRLEVVQALIKLINAEVYPVIPRKGSVGASGDLAPLAHMSLVLLGEGSARHRDKTVSGKEALKIANLEPITLAAKEGLGLLNGTQVSTAFALKGLFQLERLYAAAVACGSLSLEASLGSRAPFDARVQEARGQKGQIDAAACFRHFLGAETDISKSHETCDRVQDPYSLRCQPQIMGACLTQIRNAAEVLQVEANSASDNPLIFVDNGDIISGGNFHAEPVAMAADNLALAYAEIASNAERRIALLMDAQLSQLPPFLVENAGVNSGFMIAQCSAAALASQIKTLSFPSCVDSLPTSANQEDVVSMAPNGARRLWEMAENLGYILAVEWLAASQGLDFRKGLKSSHLLENFRAVLRKEVPFYDKDRHFAPDIETASRLIWSSGFFEQAFPDSILPSSCM